MGDQGLSVSEDDEHVYIEAHLPGLKAEDIEITCERKILWIKGEKEEEEREKKEILYKSYKLFFL